MKVDEYRSEVHLHGRSRFIVFTPEEERKLGEAVLKFEKKNGGFYDSEEDEARVRNIAKSILDVLPEDLRPPLQVFLQDTDEINAACLIGGVLFVTRGALKYFPDDELAFVICHEYGHAIARHGGEGVTKDIMAELGKKGAFFVIEKKVQDSPIKEVLLKLGTSLSAKYFFQLPYSRTMENEADALGIVYLKKAGYDAKAALRAMKRIGKLSSQEKEGGWKEFLSTHPSDKKRLKRLEMLSELDELKPLEGDSEDDSEVKLDWSLEAVEMLNDLRVLQQPCRNATGKVLFIPGIFMKDSENYLPALGKAFSDYDLEVLQWKAVKKFSWKRAVYRAGILANYLAGKLLQEPPEVLNNMTLVGHSLGSEVIVKVCGVLAQQGIKVKRVILLGSAVHFDSENLKACEQLSQDSPLIVFNPNDKVLKYLFFFYEKTPALGLLGSKTSMERFLEYRMPPPDKDVQIAQHSEEENCPEEEDFSPEDSDEKPLKISGGALKSHSALQYLTFLQQILSDPPAKEFLETTKIDHTNIAKPIRVRISLPRKGARMLETYHDWEFFVYSLSFPWAKQKTETEETTAETTPKGVFIIRNPYGQYCHCGPDYTKALERFEEIKKLIDKKILCDSARSLVMEYILVILSLWSMCKNIPLGR